MFRSLTPILMSIALLGPAAQARETASPACPVMQLDDQCFVPGGDCTGMVVRWIEKANRQVLMQAYSFTSRPIAEALVQAAARGVEVRVVLDKSQPHARGNQIATLVEAGIPVRIERMPGIAHNKILVIDNRWVETGSFNFTDSAQKRNAENALVFSGCGVDAYAANWKSNAERAEPYRAGGNGDDAEDE